MSWKRNKDDYAETLYPKIPEKFKSRVPIDLSMMKPFQRTTNYLPCSLLFDLSSVAAKER